MGKIRELIRKLVKEKLKSVKISAREWAEIERGMKEIERGEYVDFEELNSDFKKK